MARPPRQRMVFGTPIAAVYKPAGIPARQLRWVNLMLDEFEAVRLIDGEGLDQETTARRMGVSRSTVTRILGSARSKIAEVLVGGHALVIEGGPVVQAPPEFGCRGGGGGPGGPGAGGERCRRRRSRGMGRGGWGGERT